MKTNFLENKPFDSAKETSERRQRPAGARTRNRGRDSQSECVPPAGLAVRKRSAAVRAEVTTVAAKVDVGFGNVLFIRGEGAGLSWDKGQPLECENGSIWKWSTGRAGAPLVFKLLINDQLWSRGENMTAAPGIQSEVVPVF